MSYEFTKIDDNLSDEEFYIEYQKQNYRSLELLTKEQIEELISIQDPKEHNKKFQKYIHQALEQMKQKNREFSL